MHKTIQRMTEIVSSGEEDDILTILAEDVTFLPPTYYRSWVGRNAVAAVLGHVGHVFTDFSYRRIWERAMIGRWNSPAKLGISMVLGLISSRLTVTV